MKNQEQGFSKGFVTLAVVMLSICMVGVYFIKKQQQSQKQLATQAVEVTVPAVAPEPQATGRAQVSSSNNVTEQQLNKLGLTLTKSVGISVKSKN